MANSGDGEPKASLTNWWDDRIDTGILPAGNFRWGVTNASGEGQEKVSAVTLPAFEKVTFAGTLARVAVFAQKEYDDPSRW